MSKFQRLPYDTTPMVNNKVLCAENFIERGSISRYHKKKKSAGNTRKLVEVMDIFITWMVMVTRMYTYVQTKLYTFIMCSFLHTNSSSIKLGEINEVSFSQKLSIAVEGKSVHLLPDAALWYRADEMVFHLLL